MKIFIPFVVSPSNHERRPPFDKLRTGFDKLRANGWKLNRVAPLPLPKPEPAPLAAPDARDQFGERRFMQQAY